MEITLLIYQIVDHLFDFIGDFITIVFVSIIKISSTINHLLQLDQLFSICQGGFGSTKFLITIIDHEK